jgi:2'-deoxynucleoside 5'-phosphate N-hydrolase
MKIYFAGSIRGGRQFAETYAYVIKGLQEAGHIVLSEHVGFSELKEKLSDRDIHARDLDWIIEADVLVADVSLPSLGVGYEIAYAFYNQHKTIMVFALEGSNVSAMITGFCGVCYYEDAADFLAKCQANLKDI